jgi:hypothetical protein
MLYQRLGFLGLSSGVQPGKIMVLAFAPQTVSVGTVAAGL